MCLNKDCPISPVLARSPGLGVCLPSLGWFFLLLSSPTSATCSRPCLNTAEQKVFLDGCPRLHGWAPTWQHGGKSATSQHFPVSLSLLLDLVSQRQEGDRQPSASLMGQPIAVASGSGNSLKWCQGLLGFQPHVSVPFSLLSNLLWIESRLPGVHTTCLPK